MPDIRITVDGRSALTTAQAAARRGISPAGMRAVLADHDIVPAAHLDGRTPLYHLDDLNLLPGRRGAEMTTERALEILRTAKPCGQPNTVVPNEHVHDTECDRITGRYTGAEALALADHGLAAQAASGEIYATAKGRRAIADADT